jgi:hypothetical protein
MTTIKEDRLDLAMHLANFGKSDRDVIYGYLEKTPQAVCSIFNGHGITLVENMFAGLVRVELPEDWNKGPHQVDKYGALTWNGLRTALTVQSFVDALRVDVEKALDQIKGPVTREELEELMYPSHLDQIITEPTKPAEQTEPTQPNQPEKEPAVLDNRLRTLLQHKALIERRATPLKSDEVILDLILKEIQSVNLETLKPRTDETNEREVALTKCMYLQTFRDVTVLGYDSTGNNVVFLDTDENVKIESVNQFVPTGEKNKVVSQLTRYNIAEMILDNKGIIGIEPYNENTYLIATIDGFEIGEYIGDFEDEDGDAQFETASSVYYASEVKAIAPVKITLDYFEIEDIEIL